MPTPEERDRHAAGLRECVALVHRDGWEPHETAWSSEQVLGVRAVLGEPGALEQAVPVWAPVLWGFDEAEADGQTGYTSTRRWFVMLCGIAALDVLHRAPETVASYSEFHSPHTMCARSGVEYNVQVLSGPVATVGELRALLDGVPDDMPLLTDADEGGYTTIAAITVTELRQLDPRGEQDYLGNYEAVDEALWQVAGPVQWKPAKPDRRSRPAGTPREPGTALVLRREGR